ncbi:AAA family ATPase [Burkholderia pseudomallei]|nr:AAA family ATPase [Burkholderia pseudomallei]MBF3401924.1 AAA family ATPase [Burkholderia pseudomallei]MBF3767777.1 AAA family ATPase [Burkholderia pseudomallei]MBF3964320.1 AAA family ATPase [Burkholderia pseudomallei]MBF4027399.1 AAA family ATPase [Burkholderia pseudomallei]
MKLISAQVANFRSVEDGGEFKIGDLTCLVGKNEAGKTAILSALYGLNPYGEFSYDRTRDYPRRYLNKFDERHPQGRSRVIKTSWELDDSDINAVSEVLGASVLTSTLVTIEAGIGYENSSNWTVPLDAVRCLDFLLDKHKLDDTERRVLVGCSDGASAVTAIEAVSQRSPGLEAVLTDIKAHRKNSFVCAAIDVLFKRMPKLFMTSHFNRMSGEVSINALKDAQAKNDLSPSDQIFLDFLAYAGTSVDELMAAKKLEELNAKCEGASNEITDEIFDFWTQNDALSVSIDIAEGRPEDEPPFDSGTVVKVRIHNSNHRVSVPLSERSAGFIWFFSFLAQFKQLQKTAGDAIILLDEPGLTLHGKAQSDLLRYIEERLLPTHQVIYTTHSPFMVPSERLSDVLIVEDVVKQDGRRNTVEGTKVRDDVLLVGKDTLFPLQGALGYDLTQSLFVGKNTLLVEGPSDILYLQAMSSALHQRRRTSLDPRWTLCPSGGIDKIASFASLFGANRLNMAVVCDVTKKDRPKIEKLRQHALLKADQVLTIGDFTGQEESDVEDLFPPAKYADLLNETFDLHGEDKLSVNKLAEADRSTQRVVKQAEAAFRTLSPEVPEFDHFAPSGWLIRNPQFLDGDDEATLTTLERAERLFAALNSLL